MSVQPYNNTSVEGRAKAVSTDRYAVALRTAQVLFEPERFVEDELAFYGTILYESGADSSFAVNADHDSVTTTVGETPERHAMRLLETHIQDVANTMNMEPERVVSQAIENMNVDPVGGDGHE